MTYDEALNFILQKQSLGIIPGLSRIMELLNRMGNPQDKINIIHIAGTNGKGTIATTIANTLTLQGKRVGLFTSPWICDYREQIQIDGEYISKSDFAEYIDKYKDNDCSEFEFITAVMYKYFCDQHVDYAVVECGMGGAGDATNVEKKNLAVITHIAMDHTDFLGDTIQKIAHEKSGIIKSGCKCILYPNPECDCVFDNIDNVIKVTDLGDYRQNNLAVAKAVLGVLEYDCDVKLAQLPARQERIDKILIDGGHNLDAGNALAPVIDNEIAVIGMMRDKDIEGYLSVVAPKCKRIITTTPSNSRAISAKELKSLALKYCNDVEAIENPAQAVRQKGVTLVCGSFYLARDIRNFI